MSSNSGTKRTSLAVVAWLQQQQQLLVCLPLLTERMKRLLMDIKGRDHIDEAAADKIPKMYKRQDMFIDVC